MAHPFYPDRRSQPFLPIGKKPLVLFRIWLWPARKSLEIDAANRFGFAAIQLRSCVRTAAAQKRVLL